MSDTAFSGTTSNVDSTAGGTNASALSADPTETRQAYKARKNTRRRDATETFRKLVTEHETLEDFFLLLSVAASKRPSSGSGTLTISATTSADGTEIVPSMVAIEGVCIIAPKPLTHGQKRTSKYTPVADGSRSVRKKRSKTQDPDPVARKQRGSATQTAWALRMQVEKAEREGRVALLRPRFEAIRDKFPRVEPGQQTCMTMTPSHDDLAVCSESEANQLWGRKRFDELEGVSGQMALLYSAEFTDPDGTGITEGERSVQTLAYELLPEPGGLNEDDASYGQEEGLHAARNGEDDPYGQDGIMGREELEQLIDKCDMTAS